MTINTNYTLKAFTFNTLYARPLPRSKPAQRLRAEAMNDDIVEISRLRDMKLNIIDEELVTHTGFEPMLTA